MIRQVSGSLCQEGASWGWDRNGIWVDRGCRANFEVGRFQQGGNSGRGQTVQCSSDNGRRQFCPADTRGGVRLSRQISGSPCQQGSTWGFDQRGIWVDRGCRAEFRTGSGGNSNAGGSRPGGGIVTCSSDNGGRRTCPVDTRGGVRLTRQISGSPCRQGSTWGWDRNGIWVDRGCRAEFQVGR
jgi:hypothetical protein